MSEPLIGRRLELFLCAKLRELCPGKTLLPFSGGDEDNDSLEVEAPVGVISVTSAEKTHQQENTWLCKGRFQWVTHMTETTPQEHEIAMRQMVAELQTIAGEQTGYFTFHGLDISEESMAKSEEGRHRASIVDFVAGCSG
jgi:hypothetical protein